MTSYASDFAFCILNKLTRNSLTEPDRLISLQHGAQLYTMVTGELLRACEEYMEHASQATARLERRLKVFFCPGGLRVFLDCCLYRP
jgi:hypothetical protein